MNITIRPAEPSVRELAWAGELFERYRQLFGAAPDPGATRRFLAERLARGQSTVLLAHADDERAVGFVQLYPSFSSLALCPMLNDLFVVPEARRAGVGRRLMQAARAHALASGTGRIILETGQENTGAQALYQSLGYQCENDQVRFYVLDLENARDQDPPSTRSEGKTAKTPR
jgi:ribosomal protein S18 acetylase RimI-like enzyme